MFKGIYRGKKVLITGNTGFKGSWLSAWLHSLGAEVGGLSLSVPTEPSNFEVSAIKDNVKQYFVDIRDYNAVERTINDFMPDIIFHLAAQALVRKSLEDPLSTFETNTMGTLNVLESVRKQVKPIPTVCITSDKCYRNVEWVWGYRENDELGGDDSYSASKAGAEIVFRSYVNSYSNISAVTTRAGNVIGGGDWAPDRIVPDCIKAWIVDEKPFIRKPSATRPWQHVLEPLSGYLVLGSKLLSGEDEIAGQSFNFGPNTIRSYTVGELLQHMKKHWYEISWEESKDDNSAKGESTLLALSCEKALGMLSWEAILSIDETAAMTVNWYRAYKEGQDMAKYTLAQIETYFEKAKKLNAEWVK
jgi:CDP-glucose 4,6-dehydratase